MSITVEHEVDGVAALRGVVACAGRAPSVHNTQPWSFVVRSGTVEVHADDGRRLGYLDPHGRLETISCGIAVEYAALAIRASDRSCVVRLLPDAGRDGAPLATLTVGAPQRATPDDQRLFDAIPRRRTDRGPYDETAVPAAVLRWVGDVVGARGCWLRVLDRPGDRLVATRLLQQAEEIEAADPRYVSELGTWRRPGPAVDGMPAEATAAWDDGRLVSDMPLRDFSGRGRHPHPGPQDDLPRVERDAVILIGSDDDGPLSWMRAGRAVGAAWLALTAAGLAAQPLAQVTDLPLTRARLRRELGLLGQPQLMLRVGYGHGAAVTGRRPARETAREAGPT